MLSRSLLICMNSSSDCIVPVLPAGTYTQSSGAPAPAPGNRANILPIAGSPARSYE